jgi:hypothetical protein
MARDGANQDVNASTHRDARAVQHQQRQAKPLPQRDRTINGRIGRHQCENKIGIGGFETMLLVAPPRINSRRRECPYAPMTSRSTAWKAT